MKDKILMTINTVFVFFVFSTIFLSCNKESYTDGVTNDIQSLNAKEMQNPYDFFGSLHNQAMTEIYNQYKSGNQIDIYDFSQRFMVKEMGKINTDLTQAQWEERFQQDINFFKDKIEPLCLSSNPIDFSDTIFESLNLTVFQRTTLQELFDGFENCTNIDEIPEFISSLEQKVLIQSEISMKEKELVLGTLSIAKYSYQFFVSHFPETEKGLSWRQRCLKVLKADAAGFVGGVVSSVVSGHAAVGMVFGPEGAVVTVAAEGTVGAIVGSGGSIVGQIINN